MSGEFESIEAETLYLESRPLRAKIASVLRKRGWRSMLWGGMLYLLRRAMSWGYDVAHGVSTRRRVPVSRMDLTGEAAHYALSYEASDSNCLRKILGSLNIRYEQFAFVDLGAGKGRSLLVAAEFPFRKVWGAELSPRLSEVARRNCRAFRSKKQACGSFEIVCGDAAEFRFPEDPLVIYLFNPFGARILSRVVDQLEQSWAENPREVMVVYHHPIHKHLLENSPMFDLYLSGTDEWDYRKLHYDVFRAKPAKSGDLKTRRDRGEANRAPLEQKPGITDSPQINSQTAP